jgi:hypothetical protein
VGIGIVMGQVEQKSGGGCGGVVEFIVESLVADSEVMDMYRRWLSADLLRVICMMGKVGGMVVSPLLQARLPHSSNPTLCCSFCDGDLLLLLYMFPQLWIRFHPCSFLLICMYTSHSPPSSTQI